MNESFFKTPKWITDKKEKRAEEERQRQQEERYEKNRRLEEERKEEEKKKEEKEKKIFNELFNVTVQYIFANYKKCNISAPKTNTLVIEDDSMLKTNDFKWKITLDNTVLIPKFYVYIYHFGIEYNYTVSGVGHTNLKNFFLDTIYEWYKIEMLYNRNKRSYKHSNDYGGYDYSNDYGDTKTKSKKPEESEEVKNKRRRYQLLKDTLDGYNRQLTKIKEWERSNPGKTNDEKQIVLNQIDNVKDKINLMNKKFQFESIYYLKHLKSIFS